MARTKKVGPAGKFGVREGKRIRERFIDVYKTKKRTCPACFSTGLKRVSSGIWECKKCGLKFAGKAYKPS